VDVGVFVVFGVGEEFFVGVVVYGFGYCCDWYVV